MRIPLLVLAALVAAQEPAKVKIAWDLKKDQKVRYEFTHTLKSSDERDTEELELILGVALEGGDLGADRTNALKLTFERIAVSKSGHREREDYDSAKDKEPPAGSYPRVLSKCVGKTLSIRIGPSGKLIVYEEFRKTVQAAVDAFPDLKGRSKWNSEGVDVVARRLEWLLRLGFETAKGGPAADGDTWETKYDSREISKGVGSAVCKARLMEVKAGEAHVEQTVTFDFPDAVAALVKEASGKGSLTWDVKGGFLKSLGASSRIKTIKGEVTHTVTVALLPDAPPK